MTTITIDRAVVEQALEALKLSTPKTRRADDDYAEQGWEEHNAAITNLRAALRRPVQEPVAKVELMTTGGNAGLATRIVEIDDHLRERLRPGQLLYAAPPQRKPLTEKEIAALLSQSAGVDIKINGGDLLFARAIERAHGIGEAK